VSQNIHWYTTAYTFGTTGKMYFYFRYSIAVCLSFCWFLQQCTRKVGSAFATAKAFFRFTVVFVESENNFIWIIIYDQHPGSKYPEGWGICGSELLLKHFHQQCPRCVSISLFWGGGGIFRLLIELFKIPLFVTQLISGVHSLHSLTSVLLLK